VGVEHQKLYLSDPASKNVTLVNEFKPDLIRSYGSYLTNMFAYVQDTGRTFHRPKIVTYDSDGLSDSVRRLILDELKIHVFTVYGAAEAMAIGFDCERHTGIHLNIDLYPVRIVDSTGKTLANGETGDLVVSNLVNRGTILLNYRLGDLAAILPAGCSCGRSLPLLSYPPGRCDDMLQLPSGELLHPQAVRIIFTEEDLWEYQVVQQTITHFSVALVPSEKCNRQVTKDSIAKKFSQTFGEGISVDISYVDSIDRTKTGKFRPIISLAQTSPLNLMPKNGNN
jgi:phenylacetate-CoA ligase